MLDVKRMRVLREIAAQGSFSAAADALYLSQSAVSQQLSALEKEVGQKLVERNRGSIHLTQAGELLVSHTDAVLCRLEEAERELSALAGLRGGKLRLASFASASATLVTSGVSNFNERYPDVRLEFREADPENSLPELKSGGHDVAVVFDFPAIPQPEDRDLEFTLLLEERMWLALPKGHPLADRPVLEACDLKDEAWLCGASQGSCRENVIRACETGGFEPRIAFETDDYGVMQALIAAGLGVTLLPDLALVNVHPGVAIVPVKGEPPTRRVWAATLAEGSRSPAAEAMVEILSEAGARYAAELVEPQAA